MILFMVVLNKPHELKHYGLHPVISHNTKFRRSVEACLDFDRQRDHNGSFGGTINAGTAFFKCITNSQNFGVYYIEISSSNEFFEDFFTNQMFSIVFLQRKFEEKNSYL